MLTVPMRLCLRPVTGGRPCASTCGRQFGGGNERWRTVGPVTTNHALKFAAEPKSKEYGCFSGQRGVLCVKSTGYGLKAPVLLTFWPPLLVAPTLSIFWVPSGVSSRKKSQLELEFERSLEPPADLRRFLRHRRHNCRAPDCGFGGRAPEFWAPPSCRAPSSCPDTVIVSLGFLRGSERQDGGRRPTRAPNSSTREYRPRPAPRWPPACAASRYVEHAAPSHTDSSASPRTHPSLAAREPPAPPLALCTPFPPPPYRPTVRSGGGSGAPTVEPTRER